MFSNYCGFGGSGPTKHRVDKICKEHDADYAMISRNGRNPYLTYNWADKKMIGALKQIKDPGFREGAIKKASETLWKMKQMVLKEDSMEPPRLDMMEVR